MESRSDKREWTPAITHNAHSYSDLDSFAECARKYFYRVVQRLQRKRRDKNLVQGIAMHGAMMIGFLTMQRGFGEDPVEAIEGYFGQLYEEWEKLTFTDDMVELEELLEESFFIVREYFDRHVDPTWEILHVEEQFFATLDTGQVVSFTPDLVIRDRHGYVWIVDHKSTQGVPQHGVPFADMQALMYFTGVKALYPETRGFIFNYLRKKLPSEPRLTKTKKKETGMPWIASIKTLDTTYEILRDFVAEEAPWMADDEDVRQRLAELKDNDRFFYQDTIIVTEEAEASLLKDVTWLLNQIQCATSTEEFPRTMRKGFQGCEGCEFLNICQSDLLGWNSELVLETEYEPREAKNVYDSEGD